MINHLRTLLLNTSGIESPGMTYPGEEYVPTSYQAIVVPPALATIQSALFGSGADRALMNYRLCQVLTLVHSGELAQYVYTLDPRVTYWPDHSDKLLRALAFGVAAEQQSGASCALYLNGDLAQFVSTGPLYRQWTVTVLNSTQVQITQLTAPVTTTVTDYTISGGLSNTITIPNTNLSFQFAQPGTPLPTWSLTGLSQPAQDLPAILASLDAVSAAQVFGDGLVEPYKTFHQLYLTPYLPGSYRLQLYILGLGYQLNNQYQSQVTNP